MRVTLVFPPNRNIPAGPYSSLPLLAGCIEQEGHTATIVDANLEVFERLLEPDVLARARGYFEDRWNYLRAKPSPTPDDVRALQGLAVLSVVPFEHLDRARDAGRILRDPELFADPDKVNWAYDLIANLLRAVYCLNPVHYPLHDGYADQLFGYVGGPYDNPISQLVDEVVIDQVLATDPEIVGVTIPFNEQTVEALSFLKQLKARAPHVKTIVGGAIVSAFHHILCRDPRFYAYVDYAMPGEADLSFGEFLTALEQGDDLDAVANLYWIDEAREIHAPRKRSLPDLNLIASPNYSTAPNERYFLPHLVLNYQTSRGCYYGKCTFCSFDIKNNFRLRKASLVAQDLERVQEQTGFQHIAFWDPLTPPRFMRDFSRWNKDRPADKKIYWGAETKFEKVFTDREFTDLLYEGGARFMQFGYESGSQRVLDLMVKGNDLTRVDQMMWTLRQSKIAVSVQWFIGFPGATEEEDRQSYRYLDGHRDAVLMSSYMGTFTISPDDDIFESQGHIYDIDLFQHPDGTWDFMNRDGTPHYDREELHAAYLSRGDAEGIVRMAFFLYLTDHPERVREITNFERGGAIPESWDELRATRPRTRKSNFLRSFDFDVFTPPEQQGIPPEGGPLPQRASHALLVTQSQVVYPIDDVGLQLLQRADGTRTAEELIEGVEGDRAALQRRLLGFVRRGILAVPHARKPAARAPVPLAS